MPDSDLPGPDDPAAGPADGPLEPVPPIESRFLFVNVASRRANQLRRGALIRLDRLEGRRDLPHKLERAAMEEVAAGLVSYALPELAALRERK